MSNLTEFLGLLPKAEVSVGNIMKTFGILWNYNVMFYRSEELTPVIAMLCQLNGRY